MLIMDNEFTDCDNDTFLLENDGKLTESELEEIFVFKALGQNPGILGHTHSFMKVMEVLNGTKPNVDYFEPISILCIAKGIKILNSKLHEYMQNHAWHPEIKLLISCIAHDEGWIKLPDILSFAQNELDELQEEFEIDEEINKLQELKHWAIQKYLQEIE